MHESLYRFVIFLVVLNLASASAALDGPDPKHLYGRLLRQSDGDGLNTNNVLDLHKNQAPELGQQASAGSGSPASASVVKVATPPSEERPGIVVKVSTGSTAPAVDLQLQGADTQPSTVPEQSGLVQDAGTSTSNVGHSPQKAAATGDPVASASGLQPSSPSSSSGAHTARGGTSAAPSMTASSSVSSMFSSGPGGYHYVQSAGAHNVPLGMPVTDVPGLHMPRWVMCAWSVSNFSSTMMLREDEVLEVQNMINRVTTMAPGQFQLAAHANVTLALTLADLPLAASRNDAVLSEALRAAASVWSGGYDPAFIVVTFSQPDYGVQASQFQAAANQSVVRRDVEALLLPHNTSSGSSSGNSSPRRMLLQQTSTEPSVKESRDVWVSFTRMLPRNATNLQGRLAKSCSINKLTEGMGLEGSPCADVLTQQLKAAEVAVPWGAVGLEVGAVPMVSLAIRLAVGITEVQAATNTDQLLATWLASPTNIRNAIVISGVQDPIGPGAIIKWLMTPEIWVAPPKDVPRSSPLSHPANMAGVAIGAASVVMVIAALGAWLIVRRKRNRQAALDGDKHDDSSTTSSRRRRRRPGKRRYLLPEALAPPTEDLSASAAPQLSGSSSAAAASSSEAALSPDQIRPAMRELGDSVTSAVRFEDDDEDQGQEPGDTGLSSTSQQEALDGAGAGEGTSRAVSQAQRVLMAREALLAERQAGAARTTCTSSSSCPAVQPAAGCAEASDTVCLQTSMEAGGAGGKSCGAQPYNRSPAHMQQQQPPNDGSHGRPLSSLSNLSSPRSCELQAVHVQQPADQPAAPALSPAAADTAHPTQQQDRVAKPAEGAAPMCRTRTMSPFALSYDLGALREASGSQGDAAASGSTGSA